MWERRARHGGGQKMPAAESDMNERLDHLGIVAGVCQDIGPGRAGWMSTIPALVKREAWERPPRR
jgi:hypothetical protein